MDPYDLRRRLNEVNQQRKIEDRQQKREEQMGEARQAHITKNIRAVQQPTVATGDDSAKTFVNVEDNVQRVDSKLSTTSRNSRAVDIDVTKQQPVSDGASLRGATTIPTEVQAEKKLLHRLSRTAMKFNLRGIGADSDTKAVDNEKNTPKAKTSGTLHQTDIICDNENTQKQLHYPTIPESAVEETGKPSKAHHRHTIGGYIKAPDNVWAYDRSHSSTKQPNALPNAVGSTFSYHEEVPIPEKCNLDGLHQNDISRQREDEISNLRRASSKWNIRSHLGRLRRGSRDDKLMMVVEQNDLAIRPAKSSLFSRLKL